MPGGVELSEKLPDEIFQLVESFKKFVREQKAYRDQKFDIDDILEVGRDLEDFTLAFQRIAVESDRNSKLVQQIKEDTTKLLRHSELAYGLLRSHFINNPSIQQQQQQEQPQSNLFNLGSQQTNGTSGLNIGPNRTANESLNQLSQPNSLGANATRLSSQQSSSMSQQPLLHHQQPFYLSGSPTYGSSHHNQFTNTSSSQYFAELADQFEARMKSYGEQIKELKMSLDSITRTYNVDELFKWLKKQHETLGEIAAKIYMTHERIMEKKTELLGRST